MKKLRTKLLTIVMFALLAVTPVFAGCDIDGLFQSNQINAPVISLNYLSKCIVWDDVPRANFYDVYCNEEIVSTIDNSNGIDEQGNPTKKSKLIYDFSKLLVSTGTYVFQVQAKSGNFVSKSSEMSNSVMYEYTAINPIQAENFEVDTDNVLKLTLNSNVLTFNFNAGKEMMVDKYMLYIYNNTDGYTSYEINSMTPIVLDGYLATLTKEIFVIRMGYKIGGQEVVSSDTVYINSDKYAGYTDNIYMFDGSVNDYYIESKQEFDNLVYYSFIRRDTSYDIKLSPSHYDFVVASYAGANIVAKLSDAVKDAYAQFTETSNYTLMSPSIISSSEKTYRISVSYGGITECNIGIQPKQAQLFTQAVADPYYDVCGLTPLGEDYDDFASDRRYLRAYVETSEELYWAVENKVTPVFRNNTCRAYTIYNKAKNILRDIISEDMTDYEKVLSIFDYITYNTQYDYTTYNTHNGYPSDYDNTPMILPCFYLEGVFETGYSVCDGFSKSFSLMCNMMNIDAIRIVGAAGTNLAKGGHAWNKVLLDRDPTDMIAPQYYIVDITWTEIASTNNFYSSKTDENLSHLYFLLSDEDVEDTHIPHAARKKFKNYESPDNFYHYDYARFEYDSQEYDYVMKNNDEIIALFNYMLDNNRKTMEVVIDLQYMINTYNSNHPGAHYKGKQLENDLYYSKLRGDFNYSTLKPLKFNEQYLFICNASNEIVYDSDGHLGIIYIFTQNLLIDANNEVNHIVSELSSRNFTGTIDLFVDNSIFNTLSGETPLIKITNYFNNAMLAEGVTDIDVEFVFVRNDFSMGDASHASQFRLTISKKVSE